MPQIYKHYITYKSPDDLDYLLRVFFYNREGDVEDQEKSEDPNDPWITQFFWTGDRIDDDEQKELYERPNCLNWAFNRTESFQHKIGIQERPLKADLEQIFATHKQEAEIGDVGLMIDFQTDEEYKGHAFWTKEELSDEIIDEISILPGIHHINLNQSVWSEGD